MTSDGVPARKGDPRADNCKSYLQDVAGKVLGVELRWHEWPASVYALKSAILIDEATAQGRHVATVWVEDKNGVPVAARVGLSWPYNGSPLGMPNVAWPGGNNNAPVDHVISNGYNPPALGPLAIAVYSQDGQIISDVIGGLGLPHGHHVCFDLIFRERSVIGEPPPVEPPPAEDTEMAILRRIEGKLDVLLARG